jgi:hypothetical protein
MSRRRTTSTAMSPPSLNTNIINRHRFRYTTISTANNYPIVVGDLLLACGGICTVTLTTVTAIAGSVKVRAVEVWSHVSTTNAPVTCSIEWASTTASAASTREVSDTSMSLMPAHIRARPPPASTPSFWHNASVPTQELFYLTCPANSVIDVTLDFILQDDTVPAVQATTTAATLGVMYYGYLDGSTRHDFLPVSLNSTV